MTRPPSARAGAARAVRVVRLPLGDDDIRPTFRRERAAIKRGLWPIAGCDEAGRGPLAGPVVAAAVVLDPRIRSPTTKSVSQAGPSDGATRASKLCLVITASIPSVRVNRRHFSKASR